MVSAIFSLISVILFSIQNHHCIMIFHRNMLDIWHYINFRQRQLEEALLFAGQFSEALQALLDWLGKVEPTLGEDQPVHGDIDTVNNLMESHKVFNF